MSTYREMRLFVTFDLPVQTKEERKVATSFRKFLIDEGFLMIQFSVYARYCRNDSEYAKYLRKIKKESPNTTGSIRIFKVTEKQFQEMYIISLNRRSTNEEIGISPLVSFD